MLPTWIVCQTICTCDPYQPRHTRRKLAPVSALLGVSPYLQTLRRHNFSPIQLVMLRGIKRYDWYFMATTKIVERHSTLWAHLGLGQGFSKRRNTAATNGMATRKKHLDFRHAISWACYSKFKSTQAAGVVVRRGALYTGHSTGTHLVDKFENQSQPIQNPVTISCSC